MLYADSYTNKISTGNVTRHCEEHEVSSFVTRRLRWMTDQYSYTSLKWKINEREIYLNRNISQASWQCRNTTICLIEEIL
jgi:hypothetical protein